MLKRHHRWLVGVFSHPHDVVDVASKARHDRGWKHLDIMTPYPLHNVEHALGLKQSWVPWVTVVMGLSGASLGFLFASWTSAVSWPLNVGGKPLISWPAFIPVVFECGILIGGISTFVALWYACNMPTTKPRVFDERFTDDKFGLVIPVESGMSEEAVRDFLKSHGAEEVNAYED